MLRPLKRSGGRRYYRPADVALVATIDRLINREGYTLKGARQAIEKSAGGTDVNEPAVRVPSTPPSTKTDSDVLPALRSLRQRLAAALEA